MTSHGVRINATIADGGYLGFLDVSTTSQKHPNRVKKPHKGSKNVKVTTIKLKFLLMKTRKLKMLKY